MKKFIFLAYIIFSVLSFGKQVEIEFHFDVDSGLIYYSNADIDSIWNLTTVNFNKKDVKINLKNGIYLFGFFDGKDRYLFKKFYITDNKRLKKAFIELLKNAYDAVMSGKNLPRKINVIVIRDKHANKIKIDIKDNGVGMSEERLKTIQEPFVTYKDDAPGLGIPLAMRVIKDCRGVIKFNSQESEGTTIKITLNMFKENIKDEEESEE